jgi:hypothetical protein
VHHQVSGDWSKFVQKAAFACFIGDSALPVFESRKGKKGKLSILFSHLLLPPEVGPLLDNSLRPGVRPALAITRKDGR